MTKWTEELHADARAWCQGSGAKSRALAGALDEIERLQTRAEKAEADYARVRNMNREQSQMLDEIMDDCDKLREAAVKLNTYEVRDA